MFSTKATTQPSPFNPFATPTNPTAAAPAKANPFAPSNSQPRSSSPFDVGNDGGIGRKPANPFANATATPAQNATSQQGSSMKNPFGGSLTAAQSPFSQASKPTASFGKPTFGSNSSSSQPTPPQLSRPSLDAHQPKQSNDPHAKKVYQQLRNDNISPPSWPSQPGNPAHKAEMAKFREKYEAYRAKVRASLTKAGLIDDPDQRKNLADAIDFKGICEDMCPQYEQITRITEIDVHQPEKDPATSFPIPSRMVKKLARSAAGQEAPLPMDVRSIAALRRTFDYLVDDLLQEDNNLPGLHGFLWDRTRAIRRDFTFFSSLTPEELKTQVYVLENTARFHVTALHLLSQEGKAPEDFVEQQELEQLGKALLSLRDVYDDCNDQGIVCENEPEFRAYYLIFHGRDSNIIETLQRQWRPSLWRDSDAVRTAVSLVEAMQSTRDFHGPLKDGPSLAAASSFLAYFRIVEDPSVSYTMACFAECHFPHIRRSILSAVNRGLARPKDTARDVTAAVLNRFLRFDTTQQAIDFAELHGLEWASDPEQPYDINRKFLVLNSRQALAHPRLSHHFSQTLVEKKRGSSSLPNIIHESIFEDPRAAKASVPPATTQKPSLSTQDQKPTKSPFQDSPFKSQPSPFFSQPPTAATKPNPPAAEPFKPSTQSGITNGFPSASTPVSQEGSLFVQEPKAEPAKTAPPTFSFGTKASTSAHQPPADSGANASGKETTISEPPSIFKGSFPGTTSTPTPSFDTSKQPSPFVPKGTNAPPTGAPPANPFAPTISKPAAPVSSPPALFAPPQSAAQAPKATQPVKAASLEAPTTAKPEPSAAPSPQLKAPATIQPQKREPPRDRMGDFTRWYLLGDQGLLDEFTAYMVEDMLSKIYDDFYIEQEVRRKQEEEEALVAEADAFRTYNLSMRFFYRWKEAARQKRLRTVRRQARDQARKFYEQQRAAEGEARRRANASASKHQAHTASLNRPEEMMHMLSNKKMNRQRAEEQLMASGVLRGHPNEREAVADIVRREVSPSIDGSVHSRQAKRSRSGSGAASAAHNGSKTQALREQLLGGSSASFRRSLPPMSASYRSSAESDGSHRKSKASERWRLKAMGITQMPDGTAMPDSLANEVLYGDKQYRDIGSFESGDSRVSSRRASIGDSGLADSFAMPPPRSTPGPRTTNEAASPTKRKRIEDDEEAERRRSSADTTRVNSHKRIMSNAEQVISELRALRMEMEEGSAWFKEQSERLQSETAQSRGTTPWEGSI
ncbi:SAC3/GANP family protein [Sarocladium implicatum]|nr:SAC3/GANP family protein [Sarocladium implicatum]